jgi:hypothetical protein
MIMPMTRFGIFWSALLILALTVPSVRADDECILDEMQAEVKKELAAAARAEKSGRPAEIFLAYQAVLMDGCMRDKNIEAKYRAALPRLARDLAKAAEARGLLSNKEPLGTDGKTAAFAWLEASGDYNEANRVMLKAAHAKSDDLEFFKTAWDVDQRRYTGDSKTGERKPYASPAAYRQELQKIASANADRLMKAEEKDAQGLAGNVAAVATATMNSLDRLKKASEWMKFLPDGDKQARARAEQRGDTIMKRPDPTFTQMNAVSYYEFSGSAKAKAAAKQVQAKQEEMGRAAEKSAEKVKGSLTQKSEADQEKFKKGKADLEKELGF